MKCLGKLDWNTKRNLYNAILTKLIKSQFLNGKTTSVRHFTYTLTNHAIFRVLSLFLLRHGQK